MEIEELRKELTQLIDHIKEHSDRLSGWDHDHLPALEISVILAKINKLYERMVILRALIEERERQRKNLRSESKATGEHADVPGKKERQSVSEAPEAPVQQENQVEKVDAGEEETGKTSSGDVDVSAEDKNDGSDIKPEAAENQFIDDVASKLENQPITTLQSAIGLNERYLYANELFDNEMTAFNETLKRIDKCDSLKEANNILSQLSSHYEWDKKNLYVKGFVRLVERRFLSM